jgi:hypothetical protein
MTAIVVDPESMRAATVALDRYLDALELSVRALDSVTLPAGIPPAEQSMALRALSMARLDLLGAMRALHDMPADLRRRVAAAKEADESRLLALDLGKGAFSVFTGSFFAGVPSKSALAARTVRDGLTTHNQGTRDMWIKYREEVDKADKALKRSVPKGLRWGAKGMGGIANVGAAAYVSFTDPSLSNSQKVGRTGAVLATNAGVSVLSGAASGAMFGSAAGPAGLLIGAGAGLAWSFADSKLGVSSHLGDAAAPVIDKVGDGFKAVGDNLSDGFKKLGL